MREPYLLSRFVLLLFLFFNTTNNLYALDGGPAPDFAEFSINVQREGKPVPLNNIDFLKGDPNGTKDKLSIKILEGYEDTNKVPVPFSQTPYKKILILFVPLNAQLLGNSVYKDKSYVEKDLCKKPGCENSFLDIPVPFDSFPVIFLLTKGGYGKNMRDLVKNNFTSVIKSSKIPFQIKLAEQKIKFLSELIEVVSIKEIKTRKIMQALFYTARDTFRLFDGTNCEEQGNTDAAKEIEQELNKFEEDQNKTAGTTNSSNNSSPNNTGVTNTNSGTSANPSAEKAKPSPPKVTDGLIIKKQLGCLLNNNTALTNKIREISESGISYQTIIFKIANLAANILVDKFPSMGIYFTIAKLALIIWSEFFAKKAITVVSAFAKPTKEFGKFVIVSNPTDGAVTAETINQSGLDANEKQKLNNQAAKPSNNERTGDRQAVFFVPMTVFGEKKVDPAKLSQIKPEAKVPCIQKGDNGWGLDKDLLKDPLFNSLSVTLYNAEIPTTSEANASQKIEFPEDKVKTDPGFVKIKIDDNQWDKIEDWTEVKGNIKFKYGDIQIPLPFTVPKAKKIDVQFTQGTLFRFRKGLSTELKFQSEVPNCVEKVIYTFGDSSKEVEGIDDDFKSIKLGKADTAAMNPGKGSIQFKQYGFEDSSIAKDITLLGDYPVIDSVDAAQGDKFAIVKGANFGEFRSDQTKYDLVYVDEQGAESDQLKFTFKTKKKLLDNGEILQNEGTLFLQNGSTFRRQGEKFKIKMKVLGDGTEIVSKLLSTVKAIRPAFQISDGCQSEFLKKNLVSDLLNEYLMPEKSTDSSSPIQLDDCLTPTSVNGIKIKLQTDKGYFFDPGLKYTVQVIAVGFQDIGNEEKILSEIGSNLITFQTDVADVEQTAFNLRVNNFKYYPKFPVTPKGVFLRIRVVDDLKGAKSNWYTLGQEFVDLPTKLTLDCGSDNRCKLSGENIDSVELVAVQLNGNDPLWNEVNSIFPLQNKSDDQIPVNFYIKLKNTDRKITVKPDNVNFVFKKPPPPSPTPSPTP